MRIKRLTMIAVQLLLLPALVTIGFLFPITADRVVNAQGETYTFTNAGATGHTGPTQTHLDNAYRGTNLEGQVISRNGIQEWTIPATGTYRIEAWGAQGGRSVNSGGGSGGLGAYVSGEISLSEGEQLKILVGQQGGNSSGGGGTFITTSSNTPLFVAGGGGGGGEGSNGGTDEGHHGSSGTSGTTNSTGPSGSYGGGGINGQGGNGTSQGVGAAGGGGLLTNGQRGGTASAVGIAFVNGGRGGYGSVGQGGFGGGAGAGHNQNGCGGGGYSGGGGSWQAGGGGGGSFNAGENQVNQSGVNSGHGKVVITVIDNKPTPFAVNWDEDNEFPSTVAKNADYNLSLGFSNPEDAMEWNKDEVKLVIEWVRNGNVVHKQEFQLSKTYAPGESGIETQTITVPDLADGTYDVRYKLLHSPSDRDADKMQVFKGVQISSGLNIAFLDDNRFPKEWIVNEKRKTVIAFTNEEDRTLKSSETKVKVDWLKGNQVIHSELIPISRNIGSGTVFRETVSLTPPSLSGTYTVRYTVINGGLSSLESQVFNDVMVHGKDGVWQISSLSDQVKGNIVSWSGVRFNPDRDVTVNIGDKVSKVKVQYHVPMMFSIPRLFGGGEWKPMITVDSEAVMHKEKPAW